MNATLKDDSPRILTDRDVASLVGAAPSPSVWEIYNRIKGKIDLDQIESTRTWWRKHLFSTLMMGIQDRYSCVLSHGKPAVTANGVSIRPLTQILSHGKLPLSAGITYLKMRQASSHEISAKWRSGQGYSVPTATAAELHLVMEHLGVDQIGIALIVDGGSEEIFLELQRSQAMLDNINVAINDFQTRIAFDDEPEPDYVVDGAAIERLFRPIDGEVVDLSGSNALSDVAATYDRLVNERKVVNAKVTDLDNRIKPLKNEILAKLGSAQSAILADGIVITRSTVTSPERVNKASSYQKIAIKREAAPISA
jgi:hypothetical protein